ncbi:sorting nexin-25-like [Tubulanus polymorphus]|uniref:sorting nexin-25-like n=1 Tax=Tubulanus polymorphus TaxID=672921 RepID=UPI003DA39706
MNSVLNWCLLLTLPVVGFILYQSTSLVINYLFCLIVGLLGIVLSISMVTKSSQHKPKIRDRKLRSQELLVKMMENRQNFHPAKHNVVISHNLDATIQEIMDLVLRDFVQSWYSDVGKNQFILDHIKKDLWIVIGNLSDRLCQIDMVQFISQDVVLKLCTHFQEIRFAVDRPKGGFKSKFLLHPWLVNEQREIEFLRKLTEVLLVHILPSNYAACSTSRHLLREIIAMKVLKPMVDVICDPDYINQQLYNYLNYKEKLVNDTKKRYQYAASYEDFVKMIKQCHDLEMLKQMRYNIMSEIMQATAINNIKKAKGMNTEKEFKSSGTKKGDLLKARNLKRYINELTVSKTHCEKRIEQLGGPDYFTNVESTESNKTQPKSLPGKMVLSFKVIMETPRAQSYFMQYLKKERNESLLGFWLGVENLKQTDKSLRHHVAGEIYQMYIASPSTAVKLDRTLIKGMETFLTGDSGPQAFYDAQNIIYQQLEEHNYPSFIVGDIYYQYIRNHSDDEDIDDELSEVPWIDSVLEKSVVRGDQTLLCTETSFRELQSNYASKKLEILDEKIQNKIHALEGLRRTMKADPKTMKIQEDVSRELELLKQEKQQLQFHIERTSVWCENVGMWRTRMDSASVIHDDETGRDLPYFTIVIYHRDTEQVDRECGIHGWVISRTLQQFYRLHNSLVQICSWLRKKPLPSLRKFRSIDEKFLEKCKVALGAYLEVVMKDDRMAQSESLYTFLSPSPEHLKQSRINSDKKKFSITSILKNLGASDSEEELIMYDEEGNKEDVLKDSIAEPLYSLIGEIFELKGVFKLLRRTLMAFVQVTFGRTINKQLHETVTWIFSEPMLIYYMQNFRDSFWPEGKLADSAPVRNDTEKLQTRLLAKEKLILSITEFIKSLVGEKTAQFGIIKMFECLQDERLNKQFFYVLLEIFLIELCPELRGKHSLQPGISPGFLQI